MLPPPGGPLSSQPLAPPPAYRSEPVTNPAQRSAASGPGLRYLALGDSYTSGEKVKTSERFPAQLVRRLRQQGIKIADPLSVAHSGWTTAELAAAINAATPPGTFDLVTLLVGVNNQYRGLGLDEYRAQFRALLYRAIEFAGGEEKRVIALSLPDWGASPFARNFNRALVAEQIDAFNRVNRAEAGMAGTRYVDITAQSREAARADTLTAADGLHPSGGQYAAWVELLLPEALAALG